MLVSFLALGVLLLLPCTLAGQTDGTVSVSGGSGTAGGVFRIPVTLSLNSGVSIDSFSFGVRVTPNGSAPALTGPLGFTQDASLPSPSFVDTGLPSAISIAWLSPFNPAISGTKALGFVNMTIPAGAVNGQIYTLLVTGASATRGNSSVNLAPGPNSTLNIAGPALALSADSLQFIATAGANPSAAQSFQALNSGTGALGWTAAVNTQSGGNWLAVSPVTGVAPSTLAVSVTSASLPKGAYLGTITITALPGANAASSPQTMPVALAVDAPVIGQNGVVNGASFSRDAVVSPNSIVSLFGINLAARAETAAAVPLPATLAGTQVLVLGRPAPLFYVSSAQINFQMSAEAAGSSAPVMVMSAGISSLTAQVKVAPQVPGIFTISSDGTGQGAALNQDSSLNSAQNPAAAGSVIQIFATGLGITNPLAATGQPGAVSPPLNQTVDTPIVRIGGVQADVLFSGLAPSFVGLYQVNARVPQAATTGHAVSLQIQMGGKTSNSASIAVR